MPSGAGPGGGEWFSTVAVNPGDPRIVVAAVGAGPRAVDGRRVASSTAAASTAIVMTIALAMPVDRRTGRFDANRVERVLLIVVTS
jgi:hypothetical protein